MTQRGSQSVNTTIFETWRLFWRADSLSGSMITNWISLTRNSKDIVRKTLRIILFYIEEANDSDSVRFDTRLLSASQST